MSKKNTKNVDVMLSDSDEEEVVKKPNGKQKVPIVKKKIEESSDEEDIKVLNKKSNRKESNDKNNKTKKRKVEKKEESSEEQDESEEEEEVKPKQKKKQIKKEESSDNESNDDDDEEEVKPKKKKQTIPQKKKPIKEESDEEEEEAEPELVKKDSEEESGKQGQKKSYSSGTCNELFIKNLSYNTTQEGLADFFGKYGDIEETKIVYDKITERSKGVGFCRFYEADSAVKAMEDAGSLVLDGRPIAISYSNEKPPISKAKIAEFKSDKNFQGDRFGIFVGNLSFKSNEKGIENFFKDCGKIIDIRIAKTPEGKLRGFAHVDLDSKESVDKALKKTGLQLDGREIRIDISENKPKPNNNNRNSFGNQRNTNNNFRGKVDQMSKAKKSGSMIITESKSKALSDSEGDE